MSVALTILLIIYNYCKKIPNTYNLPNLTLPLLSRILSSNSSNFCLLTPIQFELIGVNNKISNELSRICECWAGGRFKFKFLFIGERDWKFENECKIM